MQNETAARRLVFFANGDHLIALAGFRRTAVEDAVRYMDNGKRLWIVLHQLATKREQAANVVPVIMRQNDFLHIRQVDVEVMCIPDHGIRVSAGIHEDTMAVHIDQRSETPFADAGRVAD
ncbi:MAG TPA: hypothetical protein VGF82_05555 [Terracidiphilus sp.]